MPAFLADDGRRRSDTARSCEQLALRRSPKARSLDRRDLENTTCRLVDDERCEGFTFEVLG